MLNKLFTFFLMVSAVSLFAGCAEKKASFSGAQYPPTEKVAPVFQTNQADDSCKVFAHLLMTVPAKQDGQKFVESVTGEAKSRGADLVLLGQARQCEEDNLDFEYYGPVMEYSINNWAGWNFGYDKWEDQGQWISMGYSEWGDSSVHFDYPVMMQMAFLRCR